MNRRASLAGLAVAAVAFVVALQQLFSLRFAAGDVYPPYSSLRADPLGTRALFESLELVPQRRPDRILGPLPAGAGARGTTLLVLGCDAADFHHVEEADAEVLERFAQEGGRLVVAWAPERTIPIQVAARATPTNAPVVRGGGPLGGRRPTAERTVEGKTSLQERWGYRLEFVPLKVDEHEVAQPVAVERTPDAPAQLPTQLAWHTSAVLQGLGGAWTTLYRREDQPVLAERPWGRGRLVLCTDSFLFSNEAQRTDRQTGWLAWMLGTAEPVWFEETHLGIEEEPGVATLARRYRLHGLVAGLGVLAALFVWRTMSTFLPRPEDPVEGGELAGRDSTAGFVNLLRRGLAPKELLATCFAEWQRGAARDGIPPAKLRRVEERFAAEQARPPGEQDPVSAYRDMAAILAAGSRAAETEVQTKPRRS